MTENSYCSPHQAQDLQDWHGQQTKTCSNGCFQKFLLRAHKWTWFLLHWVPTESFPRSFPDQVWHTASATTGSVRTLFNKWGARTLCTRYTFVAESCNYPRGAFQVSLPAEIVRALRNTSVTDKEYRDENIPGWSITFRFLSGRVFLYSHIPC